MRSQGLHANLPKQKPHSFFSFSDHSLILFHLSSLDTPKSKKTAGENVLMPSVRTRFSLD